MKWGTPLNVATQIHDRLVHRGRVSTLAERLARLLPKDARVLDVGCGDGLLAVRIHELRPDLSIEGIDLFVRGNTRIPVRTFDGKTIPHDDASFDAALLVDVLHHTTNQAALLREVSRVTARCVIIKDHLADGVGTKPLLRFMDYVGNRHAGVALPYRYLRVKEWYDLFAEVSLKVEHWDKRLRIYPPYADWIFGRKLHFCARLAPATQLARAAR